MNEKEYKKLRQVADKFINIVKEEVNIAVLLGDYKRLDLLVTQVQIILDHEVLDILRNKGFNKEIMQLCNKAGIRKRLDNE